MTTPAAGRAVCPREVWVLAGQSNMEGYGALSARTPPDPRVRSYSSLERWEQASEPLHDILASPRRVHRDILRAHGEVRGAPQDRTHGSGLGLAFATKRADLTGRGVDLIPCAQGGTTTSQWHPDGRNDPQGSLYGALLDRVRQAGVVPDGVLWYQGESEALTGTWDRYEAATEQFIAALRLDFQQPDLRVLLVQLGRYVNGAASDLGWNTVREAQRQLSTRLPGVLLVSAIDLALEDPIHLDSPSLQRLGRRLAHAADGNAPHLQAVDVAVQPAGGVATVRVTFGGLAGGLSSAGRPLGFQLCWPDGRSCPGIYRTDLQRDAALLWCDAALLEQDLQLWYGFGADPTCSLTDGRDQALPTFGPLPLPRPAVQWNAP